MKPEKGKWYWVSFGISVYCRQCMGSTKLGGLFVIAGEMMEREEKDIKAEADAPAKKSLWARIFS